MSLECFCFAYETPACDTGLSTPEHEISTYNHRDRSRYNALYIAGLIMAIEDNNSSDFIPLSPYGLISRTLARSPITSKIHLFGLQDGRKGVIFIKVCNCTRDVAEC